MTRIDEAQISILGSSFRQATSCNLKTYLAKYTDLNLIDFLSLFPAIFRVTAPLSLAPLVVLAPGVSRTQFSKACGRVQLLLKDDHYYASLAGSNGRVQSAPLRISVSGETSPATSLNSTPISVSRASSVASLSGHEFKAETSRLNVDESVREFQDFITSSPKPDAWSFLEHALDLMLSRGDRQTIVKVYGDLHPKLNESADLLLFALQVLIACVSECEKQVHSASPIFNATDLITKNILSAISRNFPPALWTHEHRAVALRLVSNAAACTSFLKTARTADVLYMSLALSVDPLEVIPKTSRDRWLGDAFVFRFSVPDEARLLIDAFFRHCHENGLSFISLLDSNSLPISAGSKLSIDLHQASPQIVFGKLSKLAFRSLGKKQNDLFISIFVEIISVLRASLVNYNRSTKREVTQLLVSCITVCFEQMKRVWEDRFSVLPPLVFTIAEALRGFGSLIGDEAVAIIKSGFRVSFYSQNPHVLLLTALALGVSKPERIEHPVHYFNWIDRAVTIISAEENKSLTICFRDIITNFLTAYHENVASLLAHYKTRTKEAFLRMDSTIFFNELAALFQQIADPKSILVRVLDHYGSLSEKNESALYFWLSLLARTFEGIEKEKSVQVSLQLSRKNNCARVSLNHLNLLQIQLLRLLFQKYFAIEALWTDINQHLARDILESHLSSKALFSCRQDEVEVRTYVTSLICRLDATSLRRGLASANWIQKSKELLRVEKKFASLSFVLDSPVVISSSIESEHGGMSAAPFLSESELSPTEAFLEEASRCSMQQPFSASVESFDDFEMKQPQHASTPGDEGFECNDESYEEIVKRYNESRKENAALKAELLRLNEKLLTSNQVFCNYAMSMMSQTNELISKMQQGQT